VDVVFAVRERRAGGEEQGAEHFGAATDRDRQGRPKTGSDQHTLEVGNAFPRRADVLDAVRVTGGDHPARQTLVGRERAGAHCVGVETDERVHEIAALLGIDQAHRQIVVRNRAGRVVRKRLEEVRRERRADQLDQQLVEAREALGVIHAEAGGTHRARASSARSTPFGTGSMGPTTVTSRIVPCLSMTKMPCS
jgi:hypothetical protein